MNQEILILIVTILGVLYTILVKKYIINRNISLIIMIFLLNIIYFISYKELLIKGNINILYPLLKIVSLILIIIVGVILFGEYLSYTKVIGILFCILSIYFLLYKK